MLRFLFVLLFFAGVLCVVLCIYVCVKCSVNVEEYRVSVFYMCVFVSVVLYRRFDSQERMTFLRGVIIHMEEIAPTYPFL